MTYPEALSFLGASRFFGMKPGLERMRRIAAQLGDPQKKLRFIHLAGTNGKGSTAAFGESCLRASGRRTGLYTSPHLVSVRERVQVDRQPISEESFALGMEAVRQALDQLEEHEATFFEIMTALALWHFEREKVDVVVWETGLGGRLDATNIVDPEVCIITNIGLDHQQYLGETLREIAAEKAGIIKPGVPVISAVAEGDAADVIQERTKELGCDLTLIRRDLKLENLGLREGKQIARINGHDYALGLLGAHQIENASCALEALRQWGRREPKVALQEDDLTRGLAETTWPGRFEVLSEKPLVVLDGAHNGAGMKCLIEAWQTFLQSRFNLDAARRQARTHLVFAAVADKDIAELARLLRPLAVRVSLVRLANERSADPATLAPAFADLPCTLYNSVTELWQTLATVAAEEPVLITGSLFLVGEILARRQGSAEEYRLNERLEKPAATR